VNALRRLLSLKNDAHFGLISVSTSKRNTALGQARELIEFAEQVTAR
jgi:phosphoribosylanthranilate isomerase